MLDRRTFLARLAGAWAYLQYSLWARRLDAAPAAITKETPEYIVIGSGAGGGTVAARLAQLGHSVLVLEAGGDPLHLKGGNALHPDQNTLPQDYQVPAFHPNSTENDALKWDFFVRHYTDQARQRLDTKYVEYAGKDRVDGIFYPRAGALGGCTAHNAMIMVYPHNQDWQDLADLTGDLSWGPENMRRYFEKLEACRYRPFEHFLSFFGINPTRHGFGGWLPTEKALPLNTVLHDRELVETILRGAKVAFKDIGHPGDQLIQALESHGDPNDWRLVKASAEAIHFTPLTTQGHQRFGTRERLRDVEKNGRLTIKLNCLVTRILFDGNRAVGVEYCEDRYRTHGTPTSKLETKTLKASREIILAGGAFNTPQLLMLSGIGPADQLAQWEIPPVHALEGVGKNLQDRYEIGVVHKLKEPFAALKDATFTAGDPPYREWANNRSGVYTTNGAALGLIKKSFSSRPLPDLFLFALIGDFRGYVPGYSKRFAEEHDRLTWAVLKAHTNNPFGDVRLRSKDPRIAPAVNFRFFRDGNDFASPDLDSVVEGVKLVRSLTSNLPFVESEDVPGPGCDTEEKIREFVMNNTWGHHASCTCKIGADGDPAAVLDSNFRVRGVSGLRVVDASIFPKIPGFFIVSSIYIAAEKAAAVIHADARRSPTT